MVQCFYILESGRKCCFAKSESSMYCFWHDPVSDKKDSSIKSKLIDLLGEGFSLEGFELKHACLDNMNLAYANLKNANLYRASLSHAHLHHADFTNASLIKCDLKHSNLNHANFTDSNLLGANFDHAKIERVKWGRALFQEKLAFKFLKNNMKDKAKEYFIEAEEIYRSLYKILASKGLHMEMSEMYYKHRLMQHYQLSAWSFSWFFSGFNNMVSGYGERPFHTVLSCLYLVIFFGFCYFIFGLELNENYMNFFMFDDLGYYLKFLLLCFYYSVSVFVNVIVDGLDAHGFSEIIKIIQAFLSHFMIALFVVVLNRKMALR